MSNVLSTLSTLSTFDKVDRVERTFDIRATFWRQNHPLSTKSSQLNIFNFGDNVDRDKLSNSTLSPVCTDERQSRNDVTSEAITLPFDSYSTQSNEPAKTKSRKFHRKMRFWLKISVKAVWCTQAVEKIVRQGLENWKHRQSAEENLQDGYNNVRQPGSGRQRSACSSACAQSGEQAKKASISSGDFAWNCHSPFKCAQDNSPWSPVQMLQTMWWSAVVWSQSHLSSHSLINNLIVCSKSCYCSIINSKLNNK